MKGEGFLTCDAPEGTGERGPLPVRVRTKTGEIVGSGVTGAPIAVPVGSYYVTMLLPDGREVGAAAPVRVSAPVEDRSSDAAPPPPAAAQSAATSHAEPPVAMQVMGEQTACETVTKDAVIWRGKWLELWKDRAPALDLSRCEKLTLSTVEANHPVQEDSIDRLIAIPIDGATRFTVVPYDECAICYDSGPEARAIAATLNVAGGSPFIDYRSLVSEETNTLLGFVEAGVLTDMVTVTEDFVHRSEEAMFGSSVSVLRAVTGAYILLRANVLVKMEQWLADLESLAPMQPDIPPLRAELFARLGRHEEAVATLRGALDGRCPWFRAGLSYMLERLRLYVDVSDNKTAAFNLTEDYDRFLHARERLGRLLPLMITTRYIATFDVPIR